MDKLELNLILLKWKNGNFYTLLYKASNACYLWKTNLYFASFF